MKALIVQGGWDGHEPVLVAKRFGRVLEEEGFSVEISDTLDSFSDADKLKALDLIVPCWTMGEIKREYSQNVSAAVASGVGLAGWHGGMCDSFRWDVEWQFMTGGQWVSHPGGDGIKYKVNIIAKSNPLVADLEDFEVTSEHYYLHIDPANEILATTRFPSVNYYHAANKPVDMPVVWTKRWGFGRVFYCSLGHVDKVFDESPTAELLLRRGFVWAAEGKSQKIDDPARYENAAKMY